MRARVSELHALSNTVTHTVRAQPRAGGKAPAEKKYIRSSSLRVCVASLTEGEREGGREEWRQRQSARARARERERESTHERKRASGWAGGREKESARARASEREERGKARGTHIRSNTTTETDRDRHTR